MKCIRRKIIKVQKEYHEIMVAWYGIQANIFQMMKLYHMVSKCRNRKILHSNEYIRLLGIEDRL